MSESDTHRTDELAGKHFIVHTLDSYPGQRDRWVKYDDVCEIMSGCGKLERELAAANTRISDLLTGIQIIESEKIKNAHTYADSVTAERKRADKAELDAKRYRWLKSHYQYSGTDQHRLHWYLPRWSSRNELDAAIDEAMRNG